MLKYDSTVSRKSSWVWAAVCRRAENREGTGKQLRVGREPEPHRRPLAQTDTAIPAPLRMVSEEELPWRKGETQEYGQEQVVELELDGVSLLKSLLWVSYPSLFYTS